MRFFGHIQKIHTEKYPKIFSDGNISIYKGQGITSKEMDRWHQRKLHINQASIKQVARMALVYKNLRNHSIQVCASEATMCNSRARAI